MARPRYELFISHAGSDKRDFASILHWVLEDALAAANVHSFLDELALRPSNDTAVSQMLEAATHATIGVVCTPYQCMQMATR